MGLRTSLKPGHFNVALRATHNWGSYKTMAFCSKALCYYGIVGNEFHSATPMGWAGLPCPLHPLHQSSNRPSSSYKSKHTHTHLHLQLNLYETLFSSSYPCLPKEINHLEAKTLKSKGISSWPIWFCSEMSTTTLLKLKVAIMIPSHWVFVLHYTKFGVLWVLWWFFPMGNLKHYKCFRVYLEQGETNYQND